MSDTTDIDLDTPMDDGFLVDEADLVYFEDTGFDVPFEPLDPDGPDEPGGPRRRPSPTPDGDPVAGPGFTLLVCGTPIAFGAFYLATINAPAVWGPLGAFALSAVFGVMYIGLFWWGSRWIEAYR
jgi:hypothetical protein